MSSASVIDGIEIPIMGYVSGKYLYVPTYVSTHDAIPKIVYAYYEKGEMVGALRENNSLLGPEKRINNEAPDAGYLGRFVYRIEGKNILSGYQKVIIFRHKKYLKYENGIFSDRRSTVTWKIVTLTSSEGYHDYLQTIKDGKCVSYIDYYYHLQYDTEAASKAAFDAARCGREIKTNEAHP